MFGNIVIMEKEKTTFQIYFNLTLMKHFKLHTIAKQEKQLINKPF